VLAVLLATVLLVSGCGSSSTLGRSSLAKRSDAVQSLAAEGALLAQDAVDGRTTSVYLREHSHELADAAAKAQSSLAGARTTPGLQPQLRRLRRLAAQVAHGLQGLAKASQPQRRTIGHTLEAAAARSGKLSEDLG
jgi:hypothetical protein